MAEHANRLINETSPYLLQHAYNPVDWYPWSEEAFTEAKKLDKPVLLSIGYAACHWCHVMAHESFENQEIAALMNDLFINIKVDREERPDIDQVYMRFVQMATGSGGWPMTVFLTPDKQPFFGGTYFPPEDRYGRQGFPKILRSISRYYHHDKEKLRNVLNQIDEVFSEIEHDAHPNGKLPDRKIFNMSVENLTQYYEKQYGGIGKAPKFPTAEVFRLFLRKYHNDDEEQYLDMIEQTLKNMGKGGIFDQLGGGFARYSVDTQWLVPHFEKMLYDNAQLASLYLDVYLKTKDDFYLNIAEETLNFVEREMLSDDGGFYSSLDADSDGEEGKFYVWSKEQIMQKLGNVNGPVFCEYFDVTENGNFEGKNILRILTDKKHLQKKFNKSNEELDKILTESKSILLSERSKRKRPGLDDKIIVSWNGLMLSAFAKAFQVTNKDRYATIIRENIEFIHKNLVDPSGKLLHSYKGNKAVIHAFLDDYANLVHGLLAVYEAILDINYLKWAVKLTDHVNDKFWDPDNYGYFYTASDQEILISRLKDENDQSVPSASGVMLMNLLKLNSYSGNEAYLKIAEQILKKYGAEFIANPYGYSSFLNALDFYLEKPKEIVVTAEDKTQMSALLETVNKSYLPNKTIIYLNGGSDISFFDQDLIKGKEQIENKPTVYVCHNFTCSAPVTNPRDLINLLS